MSQLLPSSLEELQLLQKFLHASNPFFELYNVIASTVSFGVAPGHPIYQFVVLKRITRWCWGNALHQLDDQCLPVHGIMWVSRHHRDRLGSCTIGRGSLGPYSISIWNIMGGLFIYPWPLVNVLTYRGPPFSVKGV